MTASSTSSSTTVTSSKDDQQEEKKMPNNNKNEKPFGLFSWMSKKELVDDDETTKPILSKKELLFRDRLEELEREMYDE